MKKYLLIAFLLLSGCAGITTEQGAMIAIQSARIAIAMEESKQLQGVDVLRSELADHVHFLGDTRIIERAQHDLDGFSRYIDGFSGGAEEVIVRGTEICNWRRKLQRSVPPYLKLIADHADKLSPQALDAYVVGLVIWDSGINASEAVCTATADGMSAADVLALIRAGAIVIGMFESRP